MAHTSVRKKNILITGKTSRFCNYLKNDLDGFNTYFTTKKNFNILNFKQMQKFLKNKNIHYILHIAGLSRPMDIHDKAINLSIDINIVGTANIVKICNKNNIKLIYFSTNYVYPGIKGNYKETDSLLPINNYAWSKLGGEASVQLYKNSLILRLCMTDFPFIHKKAIKGAVSSFIFNKSVSKLIPYLLDKSGIINIGGEKREIYIFAKKFSEKKVKSISINKIKKFPKNSSINIDKRRKIIKNNKKILNFKF
jgi:dTDP-4-dehydrorhamnose reductase